MRFRLVQYYRIGLIKSFSKFQAFLELKYGLDSQVVGVQIPVGSRIILSTSSRPALWPTEPPIQ
jgi:hypothetical protein